ncbi:MAG: ACT domain-containing protein [Clostridiales bacterium]|nr:ACT domain-containing protein [Clostridiales bacterium]
MIIKQVSVFIENRAGRLEKVTQTLMDQNINITSLSLADTSEYGMLRLIVSDPMEAKNALKKAGFSTMLTDVIAVKIPDEVGALHKLLVTLSNVNIEYMYAISTTANAAMILKLSDNEIGLNALKQSGYELLDESLA